MKHKYQPLKVWGMTVGSFRDKTVKPYVSGQIFWSKSEGHNYIASHSGLANVNNWKIAPIIISVRKLLKK